jgi:predicted transcriptional regulator
MELNFTGELEAKLASCAARQGRTPEELLFDVLTQYVDEESRFIEAVKRGEEALARGEYLTHEEVGERIKKYGVNSKVPTLHLGEMGSLHRRDL